MVVDNEHGVGRWHACARPPLGPHGVHTLIDTIYCTIHCFRSRTAGDVGPLPQMAHFLQDAPPMIFQLPDPPLYRLTFLIPSCLLDGGLYSYFIIGMLRLTLYYFVHSFVLSWHCWLIPELQLPAKFPRSTNGVVPRLVQYLLVELQGFLNILQSHIPLVTARLVGDGRQGNELAGCDHFVGNRTASPIRMHLCLSVFNYYNRCPQQPPTQCPRGSSCWPWQSQCA